MDFGKLINQAKAMVDKRGGVDSVTEDLEELKDVATGKGSLTDKAQAAAEAVQEPGRHEEPKPKRPPAQG